MTRAGSYVSCELGFKETTKPTGGTQNSEYWGGPTYGRAAACRRRPRRRVRLELKLADMPTFPLVVHVTLRIKNTNRSTWEQASGETTLQKYSRSVINAASRHDLS